MAKTAPKTVAAAKTAPAKKSSLQPLDDRILILPAIAEERTASGLYIPEGAKEKPQQGTVVAVGAGKLSDKGERSPVSVVVGDTVLYGKYTGTEIEVDGVKHLIARENELLAVVVK